MATNLNYPTDPTGQASSHRKIKERYIISNDQTIRAISLSMGCFHTKSVEIYATEVVINSISGERTENYRKLDVGIDYIFTEIYTSLSIIYKSEIAATIIITNKRVLPKLDISYNFLGSKFINHLDNLAPLINTDAKTKEITDLQWQIINNISTFIPSDYAKQVGAGIGFELFVYGLEKIRAAMLYEDFSIDKSLGIHIDQYMDAITKVLTSKAKEDALSYIQQFKDYFTKERLGIGNVVNLGVVDPNEVELASLRNYSYDKTKDGYITIKGISKFKEALYNNLVNSEQTGIGKHYGIYGLPLLTTLYSLRNGGSIIIDSLSFATVSGYDFNKVVYPDLTTPDDRWSIVKITNNEKGQGGTLWGTNMTTSEVYIGQLKNSIDDPNVLTWTKLYSEFDMEKALNALDNHERDFENPHFSNKFQMDLGNIENLPVADYEDLACRVPSDKYVTHKFLLGFMSTYMNGLPTVKDLENIDCSDDGDAARNIINKIKLIFTPCGPCGPCCEPNIIPVTTPVPTSVPIVDPRGQLTSWFCENNKRWDVLTDGFGGTYTKEHIYGYGDQDKVLDGCVRIEE